MNLRQECSKYLESIPERKLAFLKPLLQELSEADFVIETNLTKKERQIIAEGEEEYKKGNYITWDDLKAQL